MLCVCFWPQQVEARGPWQLLSALTAGFRPQPDWEEGIPSKALAALADPGGAQLVADERWVHQMSWPSAAEFWECITRAGPWHRRAAGEGAGLLGWRPPGDLHLLHPASLQHAFQPPSIRAPCSRRLLLGDEHMEGLRQRFMAELGADEAAPLAHSPAARVVCLRRGTAAAL